MAIFEWDGTTALDILRKLLTMDEDHGDWVAVDTRTLQLDGTVDLTDEEHDLVTRLRSA